MKPCAAHRTEFIFVLLFDMVEPADQRTTRILKAIDEGDAHAASELLPLLYAELRSLARHIMRKTPPGNTLQPTALVHEAYVRLVGTGDAGWNSRGHFYAAAAQAMRQILVDQTRRKRAAKHGGGQKRMDVDDVDIAVELPSADAIALDDALNKLEEIDPRKSQIVLLRYFAGLTNEETAATLGCSLRTVEREWKFIRAFLHTELSESKDA